MVGFYLLYFFNFYDLFSIRNEESMHYTLKWIVISVYLLFLPIKGFATIEYSSNRIINQVRSGSSTQVFDTFLGIGASLEQADMPFAESQKFLQSLIEEINAQYGMSLTKKDACRLIRENLRLIPIRFELLDDLLFMIHLIEFGPNAINLTPEDHLHQESRARIFDYGLYWPWEWNWFGLNKKNHKSDKPLFSSLPYNRDVELELPPKMAAGFMCALGGALLCIIPGGQGIGLTLIGTGLGLALDGMANGERPYYIDSITKQAIP
jgi:hypothetical protein